MGLDITAYRQLKLEPNAAVDEYGYPKDYDNHFLADDASLGFTEQNWPGRSEGISAGVYSFADKLGFRAGSYGGYGHWRNELAVLAGYPSASHVWDNVQSGPFVELINFADNEGTIGPVVAAKLAKDFADNADKLADADEYFAEKYRLWQKAFEMAADGGCVDFH